MPIGKLIDDRDPYIEKLQVALTSEWNNPSLDIKEPVLIESEQPVRFSVAHKPLHLYVIWSDWQSVRSQDRSEIILKAYEATHDMEDTLRVTLAMGLTPTEAERMGIKWVV